MKPNEEGPVEAGAPKKKNGKGLKIGAVVVLVLAAIFGVRHFAWSSSHESTDNAQVSGDVVQVSAQVMGTVREIPVEDNQEVKKGQVLVRLSHDRTSAALTQAKANLDAAIADAKAAGIDVEYTRATAEAGALQSSGSVAQAEAGIGTAESGIDVARAQLMGSQAEARSAESDVLSARSDQEAARDNLDRTKAAVDAARAVARASRDTIGANEAAVRTAQSQLDLAQKNLERAKYLNEQGAASKQQLDTATANEETASANLEAAKRQLEVARATASQRDADLKSAIAQQHAVESALKQSGIKIRIAQDRLRGAQANVTAASAQVNQARQSVSAATAKRLQSLGEKKQTQNTEIEVRRKEAARQQALARIEQAQGAVAAAQVDLDNAVIVAPCDGKVNLRGLEVGAILQPGMLACSIVQKDSLSVTANFKETQISNIKPGQRVAVEVDGLPGIEFHGHVDSSSPATGATFSLLPPDNSTGNFVKVVQRVPVKIALDDSPDVIARLHVGMSALATVSTK